MRNYWGHCCQSDCVPEALRGVHVCKFWQVRDLQELRIYQIFCTPPQGFWHHEVLEVLVSITFRLLGLQCINTKHDCHLSCNGQHGLVQHQPVLLQEHCWTSIVWSSEVGCGCLSLFKPQGNKSNKQEFKDKYRYIKYLKWHHISKIHVWCLNTKNDNHKQILHECAYARIHICMHASIHPSIRTQ